MKKKLQQIRGKILTLEIRAQGHVEAAVRDCSGSETVEKLGMFIVGAMIVVVVIELVKGGTLKTMFASMITKAQGIIDAA